LVGEVWMREGPIGEEMDFWRAKYPPEISQFTKIFIARLFPLIVENQTIKNIE
jgi:hypothetical protein